MRRVPWLRGAALAKVTLSLRVVGTRPDGYHDIEALTVSTNAVVDFVHVNRRRRDGVTLTVWPPGAAPAGADNLVVRAIERLRPSLPFGGGLRVRVNKSIPMGAGLGGGSSDAAAVLRLLGHVGGVDEAEVYAIAAELGSDVPFCLRGTPAWMRGRGEVLEPVDGVEPFCLLLAVPPFHCSTPAVYRAWDELGGPRAAREIDAPPSVRHLVGCLANDLETAAEHLEPQLASFRERLEDAVQQHATLCGSGSSYAVWYDDPEELRDALDTARVALPSASVYGGVTI